MIRIDDWQRDFEDLYVEPRRRKRRLILRILAAAVLAALFAGFFTALFIFS